MKVIYLDIDGVLCSARTNLGLDFAVSSWQDWDPVGTEALIKVCEFSGAQIVISSSWRLGIQHYGPNSDGSYSALAQNLKNYNLEMYLHKDWKTKDYVSRAECRGEEIKEHAERNNVIDYVILDNDSDMIEGQRLIKTSGAEGMTYGNIKELYLWAGLLKKSV
jgi:hypothetical protein